MQAQTQGEKGFFAPPSPPERDAFMLKKINKNVQEFQQGSMAVAAKFPQLL